MKTIRKTAISLALASSFLLPLASFAASDGMGGPPPPGKHGKKMKAHGMSLKQFFQKLDLTPSQQEHVISILKDTRKSSQDEMQQLRESRGQIRQMIIDDSYTSEKAQTILQKRSELMEKVIANKVQAEARIYSALTTPQKDKLKERALTHEY